jgi:hypothetical protein
MKRSILIVVTVLLMVLVSALAASAQGDKKDQLITLELKDSPIRVALDTLFMGRGLNYVIDQSVAGSVSSLSLRDVSFDQALKVLLKSVDPPLVYRKDGDVYIISVKKEEPLQNPNTAFDPLSSKIPDEPIPADDIKMEKIALNFVDAFDLKDLIQGGDTRNSGSASGFGGMNSGMGGMNSGMGGMNSGMGGYGMGGMNSGMGGYGGGMGGYGGYGGYGNSGSYGSSGSGGFGIGGYRGSRSGY